MIARSISIQSLELVLSRSFPFIDAQSLEERYAREALFKGEHGVFILYMSGVDSSSDVEERVLCLNTRDALIWINEAQESLGTFWD